LLFRHPMPVAHADEVTKTSLSQQPDVF